MNKIILKYIKHQYELYTLKNQRFLTENSWFFLPGVKSPRFCYVCKNVGILTYVRTVCVHVSV